MIGQVAIQRPRDRDWDWAANTPASRHSPSGRRLSVLGRRRGRVRPGRGHAARPELPLDSDVTSRSAVAGTFCPRLRRGVQVDPSPLHLPARAEALSRILGARFNSVSHVMLRGDR
jgi:hypothetical protein